MVIDTSALVAILFDEPERSTFAEAIAADPRRLVSVASVLEASIVVEAQRGEAAGRELDVLLHRMRVAVVACTEEQVDLARDAWRRFGKGRHPAALNFGDCFAYALARHSGEPLLFKGGDFGLTDVRAVVA
ncbi:MAG: type II toxin-antitoxin system VapC family toxin [Acidimicrobiia bacterium]|nr:type II toxin-antitoxin system VapC family toxin [Acidimicrobiia bacterium]